MSIQLNEEEIEKRIQEALRDARNVFESKLDDLREEIELRSVQVPIAFWDFLLIGEYDREGLERGMNWAQLLIDGYGRPLTPISRELPPGSYRVFVALVRKDKKDDA